MGTQQYQLIVIGGGAGGIAAAREAARLGAKVAVVEKRRALGGESLNSGCIPSKTLVRAAQVAQICRSSEQFGMTFKGFGVDFQKVMERRYRIQQRIAEHYHLEHLERQGIDVFFGVGQFVNPHEFKLADLTLQADYFILATGSRPAELDILGLREAAPLNSETILGLLDVPPRLAIIGAGPVGLEYAQVMQRLGSKVFVLESRARILPRDDAELASRLERMLASEGMEIHTSVQLNHIERLKGVVILRGTDARGKFELEVQQLMQAVGRKPNVEGLGLEGLGIKWNERGIEVDGSLRTSARNIFAIGDVSGVSPYVHVAEYQAGIAIANSLLHERKKADYRAIPWVTYTDPELAQVGLTEEEAKSSSTPVEVLRYSLADNERAIIESKSKGMAKVLVDQAGKVLGASILADHAGDLIAEYTLAVRLGLNISDIAQTVHPYPSMSQVLWRVAQQFRKTDDISLGKITQWFAWPKKEKK